MRRILITGGAGFIGSQVALECVKSGFEVAIVDDFSSGHKNVINILHNLVGCSIDLFEADIRNFKMLSEVFTTFAPDAVIHLAGVKSVSESLADPLKYYDINVSGSVSLLAAMDLVECSRLVFSSSATLYGAGNSMPCTEMATLSPINPYGRSKLIAENIISDWVEVSEKRQATVLRYFNPVGADPSGLLGEDVKGTPSNLMPYVIKVALGHLPSLPVFGEDYDTVDGSGVRDFIHVVDLAKAHLRVLEHCNALDRHEILNVGTGCGISVKQLIHTFELVNSVSVPFEIKSRRQGDAAEVWADTKKIFSKVGWKSELKLEDMCADAWRWALNNPNGF
jgi:UDP-glucose 4-epimerase